MKTPGKLLYLSREEVKALGMGPAEYLAAVEEGLLLRQQGRIQMPPKTEVLKWISGYDHNPSQGLPALMGLMVLNDG